MQGHDNHELLQLQQRALSALPSTLLLLDGNLDVTFCNRQCVDVDGEPCGAAVGRNVSEVLPAAFLDATSLSELARSVATADGSHEVCGVEVEQSDGQGARYFDLCLAAAGSDAGRVLVKIDDVTSRYVADLQRCQTVKMTSVGRLAGGVAHDFNNLLMVVMTSAEFAKEELPPDSTAQEDLDDILAAAERASALTRQLLAFSRRQPLTTFLLSLNTVIEEVAEAIRERLGDDVEFVLSLAPDLPLAKADATQLEEVLLTLAVNAREAMREGGTFTIGTARAVLTDGDARRFVEGSGLMPGEFVELVVSDTGRGMDEEVKVQIFEPFFTTKQKGRGPGLGLATVYGIVKQHKGYVEVTSKLEQGTTFHIYLPRVEDE